MKRLNLTLADHVYDAIERLATRHGQTMPEWARAALVRDAALARELGSATKPDKPKAPGRPPKPRSLTELQLIAVTEEIHNRRDATRRRVGNWATYKARHLSGPGHLESALREVARYHYEGKMMEYPGLPSETFDSSYIDDPADRLFIEEEVRRLIAAGT